MDASLREKLPEQLEAIAPESGLIELVYPSFTKSFGNEMSRTCAADVLAGAGALLEAAKGVKITVEVEGGKGGGGELFGSERLWDLRKDASGGGKGKENMKPVTVRNGGGEQARNGNGVQNEDAGEDGTAENELVADGQKVWVQNFWAAYDALGSK
jgi:cell division control protein 45